jgi:poly-gamma-glutamate synthesis protein (capsule biosynthesis protein)
MKNTKYRMSMKRIRPVTLSLLILCVVVLLSFIIFYPKNNVKPPKVVTGQHKAVTTSNPVNPAIFQLTLNKIFSQPNLSGINPNDIVTIKMTGDIIPARVTNYNIVKSGNFDLPYLNTASWLRSADLTITNLESPLISGCALTLTGMTFCGDPRNVQGLSYAGIDIASLANNHSDNQGAAGLAQTEQYLTAAGISYIPDYGTIYKTVKGTKFAFLAFNGVGEAFDLAQIKSDIEAAKKKADVVVIIPHWGKEYVRVPVAAPGIAPDDPKVVAKAMINDGADLIIGNHPHYYQSAEIYKNKLIVYAHGNFVFDQDWSTQTTIGIVGEYQFYQDKLVGVTFKPIEIANDDQPYFLEGAAASNVLATMKAASWQD